MTGSESAPVSRIARFARRRRRWLVGAGVAIAAYAALGFLLAPWLVKKVAVDTVRTQLGAELRIEKLAINPFALSIRIEGLEFDDREGSPVARADIIYANFQSSSLFRWAWSFAEIRFDAPELFLARSGEGVLNLATLVPPSDGEPAAAAEPPSGGGLPRLFIHRFAIKDARVDWQDEVPPEAVETVFGPVSVEIAELNTLPDRAGEQTVVITTESEGTLSWTGSLQLNPFATAGHAEVRGSHFPLASAYIRHETGLDIADGTAGIDLDYAVSAAADGSLQVVVDNVDVEFAEVRVNTFHAEPDDLRVPREFLHIPRLALTDGSFRWPEQAIRIGEISLDSASLELRRLANGSFDFATRERADDEPAQTGATEPDPADSTPAWDVTLDRLAINGFAASLEDLAVEPTAIVGFRDLELEVVDISNAPGAAFPTTLSLRALAGGDITANGTMVVLPVPNVEVNILVDRLALEGAHPYLKPVADVNLDSGHLNLDGRLVHQADDPFAIDADVEVIDFLLTETDAGTKLGSWDRLLLDGFAFSVDKRRLDISEVLLEKPYGDVRIAADGSVNLGRIARERETADDGSAETEQAPQEDDFVATIGRVEIRDAAADFADESLPLPFAARINDLSGSLTTIATNSSEPSTVALEGAVDEYGLFRMSGVITPLDATSNTDITLAFENVDVPKFSAYSIPFAGREIASGKLDLDLGYQLQDRKLVGSNKVVLREFELGEKVEHPGAASLPLGLAVALLKDPSGKIDIDLPVSGDLDDPEFGYGRVIGSALANLIVKIVASPFALLGNLVGAEASELEHINFQPGRADLAPPERERIAKLAEALTLRPVLRLEISGVIDRDVDAAALRTAKVDDRVSSLLEAEGDGEEAYAERRRAVIERLYGEATGADAAALRLLRERFTQTDVDPESGEERQRFDKLAYTEDLRRQLIELEPLDDSETAALARSRAENARAAVIAAGPDLEPRVSVIDLREEESDRDPDSVRMKMTLTTEGGADD